MSFELAFDDAFEGNLPLFERIGRPNGFTTWSARSLAEFLGYKDYDSLRPAINKAQQVLLSLEIDLTEHFQQEKVVHGERTITDMRLTRFAVYLVSMNADPKKKAVAQAQAYFARFSEECQRYMDEVEMFERVLIRDDVSEHEKTLSSTAKRAGVKDFGLFQNAGYRGLYNMNLAELKARKAIPAKRSPLDFMGKDELAANLFRLTQTEAKIKREEIKGQRECEAVAENVGEMVRQTMHEISGQKPEDLPAHEDIRKVRLGLKGASDLIKHTEAPPSKPAPERQEDEYLEAPYEPEVE